MRKLSGIFAALLLLLSACAPAAAPTEATTPETQGEELVSTLSMLPKQAISIHRAETPAEEDTETDRTDIVFVPYYASVEQLTSNSWVDQTHVTKSTVLNLTKTDAVEVKWEANALLAGGRWVTSQEELQTVCSYLRSRAEDGVLHLTDEACSAPAEAFGSADFFAEQKLLFDRPLPSGQRHPARPGRSPRGGRHGGHRPADVRADCRRGARKRHALPDPRPGRLHRRGDHAVS